MQERTRRPGRIRQVHAGAGLVRGLDWRLVILLPELDEVLCRSRAREKRVLEAHSRTQNAACAGWPATFRVDTTGRTVEENLALVRLVSGT